MNFTKIILSLFFLINISAPHNSYANLLSGKQKINQTNISIVIAKDSPTQVFGASKLKESLLSVGIDSQIINNQMMDNSKIIKTNIILSDAENEILKEGYSITKKKMS